MSGMDTRIRDGTARAWTTLDMYGMDMDMAHHTSNLRNRTGEDWMKQTTLMQSAKEGKAKEKEREQEHGKEEVKDKDKERERKEAGSPARHSGDSVTTVGYKDTAHGTARTLENDFREPAGHVVR